MDEEEVCQAERMIHRVLECRRGTSLPGYEGPTLIMRYHVHHLCVLWLERVCVVALFIYRSAMEDCGDITAILWLSNTHLVPGLEMCNYYHHYVSCVWIHLLCSFST